ncbi:23S rRNA 5-methyluridine methyltransferase [mine drainage metagenome]|uniref:23S rRNA 5-methyluridine methyltransferase n=3 Tax=mine drainage metagenome TaxID=410659 RepID=T1C476_9ZZZZ
MTLVDLEISDLMLDGRGVSRSHGKVVFVRDALPGEVVRARIVRHHASYDEASCLERMLESADRQYPRCMHFGQCGGCTLQILDTVRQVELKTRAVLETLERVGSVRPGHVEFPSRASPWFYRRRARFHPRKSSLGTVFGFLNVRGTHVVPILECPVLEYSLKDLPGKLTRILGPLPVSRRMNSIEFLGGDHSLALALYMKDAATDTDRSALVQAESELGIPLYLVTPDSGRATALSPDPEPLTYRMDRFDLAIGFDVTDFIQINREINLELVDDVVDWLTIAPKDRILDLYAGVGNFTLPLARFASSVTAVEGHVSAIETLKRNIEQNRIENVSTAVSDLNEAPAQAWGQASYDALVLDPPRAGAARVLPQVTTWNPSRVLYVSCHPGTLARDAKVLVHTLGYTLSRLRIYDMFPQTEHVETLAMFVRA